METMNRIVPLLEKLTLHKTKKEGDLSLFLEFPNEGKERIASIKQRLIQINATIFKLKQFIGLDLASIATKKAFSVREKGDKVFSEVVSDKGYHKTPFMLTIEEYKIQLKNLKSLISMDYSAQLLGMPFKSGLGRTKKYAFKIAYFQLKGDNANIEKTLKAFEEYKKHEKARNAGNKR